MRHRVTVIALIALGALSACSSGHEVIEFTIVVKTFAENNVPLGGATVTIANSQGKTNSEGTLSMPMKGAEGAIVKVEAECPDGYRIIDPPRPVTLRKVTDVNGNFAPIELSFQCVPKTPRVVVVVDMGQHAKNLPVLLEGVEVTRTTEDGYAMVSYESQPSRRFTVRIDTSGKPNLKPPNPQRDFSVPDHNEILAYQQYLVDDTPPPPKKKVRRRRRRRAPSGPTRL